MLYERYTSLLLNGLLPKHYMVLAFTQFISFLSFKTHFKTNSTVSINYLLIRYEYQSKVK